MLIESFKKRAKKMAFVGFRYSKKLWKKEKENETLGIIESLNEVLTLQQQFNKTMELWRALLEDAIVFLKFKDHRERSYHDAFAFGVDGLADFFKSLGSFERSFSPILTRSRDHLVHVVRTYLLGVHALSQIGFKNIKCGDDRFKGIEILFKRKGGKKARYDKHSFEISESEKEAMWCIIALCHDLGLVLENVFHINQEARIMFKHFGRLSVRELEFVPSPTFQSICDSVLRIVSSDVIGPMKALPAKPEPRDHFNAEFAVHIQPKYQQKLAVALDNYDHGVLSCVVLMKNLIYFLESDNQMDFAKHLRSEDARQFLIRRNILRAIASHNCESIYHIGLMNFSFLLLLFDEMQEWDRPRSYMFLNEDVAEATLTVNEFSLGKVDFNITFASASETTHHREIYEYAKRKRDKFNKVLRCAVEMESGIDLKFSITDNTESKMWTYALHHPSPRPYEIREEDPEDEEWKRLHEQWSRK